MTWASVYEALSGAIGQITVAGFTLLPAIVAGAIYQGVLSKSSDLSLARIALHFGVAFIAVWVVAYVFGRFCAQDEFGYCLDSDWVPSTTQQRFEAFLRLTLLTVAGMLWALKARSDRAE